MGDVHRVHAHMREDSAWVVHAEALPRPIKFCCGTFFSHRTPPVTSEVTAGGSGVGSHMVGLGGR